MNPKRFFRTHTSNELNINFYLPVWYNCAASVGSVIDSPSRFI